MKYSELDFAFHSKQPARELLEAATAFVDSVDPAYAPQTLGEALRAAIQKCREMVPPRISELKPGDQLIADDGFTCIARGRILTVGQNSDGELFVPCTHKFHALDGQRADVLEKTAAGVPDDELVGLVRYRAPLPVPSICDETV